MNAAVVVLMLTLLLGAQPVTTDLYLPALPLLTRDMNASVASTQLTLSVLIICFGFGQLLCGPLSDRYGRRPVLLWGMSLYAIAGTLAVVAPSIAWLIALRALQGAGLASAVTCGRSIVRDLFEPHEGARVMSRALTGLGVLAMLSPLIGGVLAQWVGWRAALSAMAIFGAATLAYVAWRFEETLSRPDPNALRWSTLLSNWGSVVRNPTFRAWTTLTAVSYGGLFLFLAGSSFVYIEIAGLTRIEYGIAMATNSIAYISGTWLCRRLLVARGLRGAVQVAGFFSVTGGLAMAALSIAGLHTWWALLLPQWVFSLGHGIHQPCGQVGAIGPFPNKAGTAAALSGFAMTVMALLVGLWLGRSLNGTVYPLSIGMGVFGTAVGIVAWTLVRRHGEPKIEPQIGPALPR